MLRNIPRGRLYTVIRLLSLVALVFASALAVDYYFNANTFCGAGHACDTVAKSDFGQKYGIFLPTLGLAAYSFFFLTSFFFSRTKKRIFGKSLSTFWIPLAIICCAVGAFAFVLIQAFNIHAFCYLCMGIDTSAMLMVIPAVLLMISKNEDNVPPTKLHPMFWIGLYVLAAGAPLTWGSFQPEPAKVITVDTDNIPKLISSHYQPGKINIVEISSFNCPFCRKLHPVLSDVIAQYGDNVNFNRLTIPLHGHTESCVAYFCAEKQKKETAFADCMFEKPGTNADELLAYAKECSINEESFKKCLVDPETMKAVTEVTKQVSESGFEGAPTVWIGETQIVGFDASKGAQPYIDAIEAILKKNPQILTASNNNSQLPAAFIVCLFLAGLCLVTGTLFSIARKKD